ncbi:MAG: tetratricopeptide repeat protein, partial [Candidatus Saccharimonadales bacterium]
MELYRKLDDQNSAQEQLALAQQEIGKLDERGPDRASFLRLRALIEMNAGQLNSALSDMKEALALSPRDPNNLQLDGDLLMKMGRTEDAIAVYKRVLAIDPKSRFALTSLGYASRTAGRDGDARRYFERLAHDYPTLAIPYLALGDMYTAHRQFAKAEASYRKAYSLSPNNALIVAGGMNAGIEAHKLDATAAWYRRVTDKMRNDPQILKETERYLRLSGQYRESADVGRKAIEVLPQDRDVVVYLGYDLLQLGKYDELAQLTAKYNTVFPKEPDIPLLDGYVQKHNGNLQLALRDFTEALRRDPDVVTAYVNRGYVLNDLHNPTDASKDFEAALKR